MRSIRAFWWAPYRDLRMAVPELKANPLAWVKLAAGGGRPLMNFGDELSALVLELATGRSVRWAPPERADVVGIGSVLELYAARSSGATIWGTGLRNGSPVPRVLSESLGPVIAVRGVLTRQALGLSDETPLGDPGVLAPALVTRTRNVTRRPLLVPHFRTWAAPTASSLLSEFRNQGFDIAAPNMPPLDMISRISNASLVVTSSLHGIIVAHALGVPVQPVTTTSNNHAEPDFKYTDYFSSIQVNLRAVPHRDVLNSKRRMALMEDLEPEVVRLEKGAAALADRLLQAAAVLK